MHLLSIKRPVECETACPGGTRHRAPLHIPGTHRTSESEFSGKTESWASGFEPRGRVRAEAEEEAEEEEESVRRRRAGGSAEDEAAAGRSRRGGGRRAVAAVAAPGSGGRARAHVSR